MKLFLTGPQVDDLSRAERESLLRNDLRPAIRPFKGNKLMLRFATLGLTYTHTLSVIAVSSIFSVSATRNMKGKTHMGITNYTSVAL